MRYNIFKSVLRKGAMAALALAAVAMTNSCKEDEYTSRGDLFQPRFLAGTDGTVIISNHNDMTLVWYEVNDAKDYTVQLFEDVYYQNLFMEFDTPDSYVFIEDLPYSKQFYVRVRSNAYDPANNSQWALCNFSTEERPEYSHILDAVNKNDITDNGAVITFHPDATNPVDSFSVVPAVDVTVPSFTGYLTEEQKSEGRIVLDQLNPTTLYYVNIYDTTKPRKYDKPYNQVSFRTTGPAPAVFEIGITDDLNTILTENNLDPDIPDGCEYQLVAGTTYTIQPFAIRKGFSLIGPADGTKPIIVMNGTWNMAGNAELGSIVFQNVEFRNQSLNQYFFNTGNPYSVENISFTNCTFRNIYRGFWRHQSVNTKHIQSFEIENCLFDQCGWQASTYGTFAFGSAGKNEIGAYDQLDNLTIRNCTFSRGGYTVDPSFGWGNLIDHQSSSCPVNLVLENITIYDFCVNNVLINIASTERSTVAVRNVIVASPCGELLRLGSRTSTEFVNNYTTRDYPLGGSQISATDLPVKAADLFQNPENGDYTVKDHSSPVYSTRAGDTRWIQ